MATGEGRRILSLDDTVTILEKLLPAMNKAYYLGLTLNIKKHDLDALQGSPKDKLTQIISLYLEQENPTWERIVEALRRPSVELNNLAKELEKQFCSFKEKGVQYDTKSASYKTVDIDSSSSDQEVISAANNLKKDFHEIIKCTISHFERCKCFSLQDVALLLALLLGTVSEHKFHQCLDHSEMFRQLLEFYLSYFAYDLLDELLQKLVERKNCFGTIYEQMGMYKYQMAEFKKSVTLDKYRMIPDFGEERDAPPGFRKMIIRHNWQGTVVFKYLDNFKWVFLKEYGLKSSAMVLISIEIEPLAVTWIIPRSCVRGVISMDKSIIYQFQVCELVVDGCCLHPTQVLGYGLPPLQREQGRNREGEATDGSEHDLCVTGKKVGCVDKSLVTKDDEATAVTYSGEVCSTTDSEPKVSSAGKVCSTTNSGSDISLSVQTESRPQSQPSIQRSCGGNAPKSSALSKPKPHCTAPVSTYRLNDLQERCERPVFMNRPGNSQERCKSDEEHTLKSCTIGHDQEYRLQSENEFKYAVHDQTSKSHMKTFQQLSPQPNDMKHSLSSNDETFPKNILTSINETQSQLLKKISLGLASHQMLQTVGTKSNMKCQLDDLSQFREGLPITQLCDLRKRPHCPPNFETVTVEFVSPKEIMMEDMEQFRLEYVSYYSFGKYLMSLVEVNPHSSIVTWFVPDLIAKKLKTKVPEKIFKKYSISKLFVGDECIYELDSNEGGLFILYETQQEEYRFVIQPSGKYFCPVTTNLMLKPQLTECCGQHISQEASIRIQQSRGACPFCNESVWRTMLNKKFQRKINTLLVFCRHKEKGCEWKGELSQLEQHIASCPRSEYPPLGELTAKKMPPKCCNSITENDNESSKFVVQSVTKGLPFSLARGSVEFNNNFAYFTQSCSRRLYRYQWSTEEWKEIQPGLCYYNSSLVIIDGKLTAVGGRDRDQYTNKILTLEQGVWVMKHPPMKVARSDSAIVTTTENNVIVIGGYVDRRWTTIVEMFHVGTSTWLKLANLPSICTYVSATRINRFLYVIGGNRRGYCCSLHSLPSPKLITSSGEQVLPKTHIKWTQLPQTPVYYPAVATLGDKLVIVGGLKCGSSVAAIHLLDNNQWEGLARSITTPRWSPLLASPSPNQLMIVGGYQEKGSVVKNVEDVIIRDLKKH